MSESRISMSLSTMASMFITGMWRVADISTTECLTASLRGKLSPWA